MDKAILDNQTKLAIEEMKQDNENAREAMKQANTDLRDAQNMNFVGGEPNV